MDSLRHKGHLLGVLRRLLFLKENPHSRQQAGSMTKRLTRVDFEI
jgi:hypothetical protein